MRKTLFTLKKAPGPWVARAGADGLSRWPSLLAGVLALILYLRTLAPGLTWAHHGADGGDLLAAALTQGVPHPAGYPTYQLLLRAAIRLFGGEPAWAGNLLSACCAALAVALLADLTRRTLAGVPRGVQRMAALAAGLLWATSPGLWSQAVITEVYALNALAVVAVLWLAWRGREAAPAGRSGASFDLSDKTRPEPVEGAAARHFDKLSGRGGFQLVTHLGRSGGAWLAAAGLVFGLGLGNHLTLVLAFPGLLIWLWPQSGGLRYRRIVAQDAILRHTLRVGGPLVLHRDRREWLWSLFAFALGLSVYAYLLWAARQGAPVNWGDPGTPGGFWWVVSATIYRPMVFGIPLADLPQRLAAWGAEAGRQLGGGPWGMLIALLGLWRLEQADRRWWWTTTLGALAYTAYGIGYNSIDSYVYLIPAWAMASLWAGRGIAWLAARAAAGRGARWGVAAAVLLAVGLPGVSVARWWPAMDLSHDRAAQTFLAEVQQTAAADAIILVGGDEATFALWYGRYGLRHRLDITPVNVHLYDYPWYQAALLRHHPALATFKHAGELLPIEEFVREAARRGPLYRADALAGFVTGLREEVVGGLVRLALP